MMTRNGQWDEAEARAILAEDKRLRLLSSKSRTAVQAWIAHKTLKATVVSLGVSAVMVRRHFTEAKRLMNCRRRDPTFQRTPNDLRVLRERRMLAVEKLADIEERLKRLEADWAGK